MWQKCFWSLNLNTAKAVLNVKWMIYNSYKFHNFLGMGKMLVFMVMPRWSNVRAASTLDCYNPWLCIVLCPQPFVKPRCHLPHQRYMCYFLYHGRLSVKLKRLVVVQGYRFTFVPVNWTWFAGERVRIWKVIFAPQSLHCLHKLLTFWRAPLGGIPSANRGSLAGYVWTSAQ